MDKIIYKDQSFEQMMEESYAYNAGVHRINPDWNFMKLLYEANYISSTSTSFNIPKKIHQVWVGSKIPDIYKKLGKSWKKFNSDYDYILWDDDNIKELSNVNWDLYNTIKNPAQRSDFLRYHILNEFGGIYTDTDFECLKPFDDLMYLEFFTGIGFNRYVELYIGLIGSVPYHPISTSLVNSIKRIRGGNWRTMFDETGSYYFTRQFIKVSEFNHSGVVAFPMQFFYPFPNHVRETGNYKDYIKSCSYAVHHWAVSWAKFPKR